MSNEVQIHLLDMTDAEGEIQAQQLTADIKNRAPDIQTEMRSKVSNSQDMGATLVLLLGTAAAQAIAQGIATYLSRRGNTSIEIEADGRKYTFHGDGASAAEIAKAFMGLSGQSSAPHS
ncbi:hypothetical protein [Deinococcus ruber]|uniref:Uncharacterized protein n=1 Tax=Deinococcus ruber TaxID=1848197 RepID=A0A918FET0_9DEIO|nr:hypothetical protein [Deinococcus ruber]GGR30337.1 hypothetical protein GCM10008957_46420 [Deinococcus ruber]